MHPVLRLAPDRRARTVDHGRGHFLAAAGRQAMHEPGARSEGHQRLVDLVRLELSAPRLAVLAAHRDPDVCVHDVGAFDRFARVGERAFEAAPGRACADELRAGERTALGQRARDVVAVADERNARALEAPQELLDRQQIGERLERVIDPGEHVEHRSRV